MKRILLLTVISFSSFFVQAQTTEAGWGNLDYDVPESPAFKILGVDASDYLIKPSSAREIGVGIGNYFVEKGFVIPPKLAVELSPLAFKPHCNLTQYNKNLLWNRSAISLGTSKNDNGGYALGIGLKVVVFDKTDLRADADFLKMLTDVVVADATAMDKVSTFLRESENKTAEEANAILENDAEYKKAVERYNSRANEGDAITIASISKMRKAFKDEHWNDQILTIGAAGLFNSRDSLIKNINGPDKMALWLAGSQPLGKKSQLLYGLKGQMEDDTESNPSIGSLSIGMRLYYGVNNFKGFLEYENKYKDHARPDHVINLGLERNLINGIWLNFSLGVTKTGGDDFAFTPAFSLKFATPEEN